MKLSEIQAELSVKTIEFEQAMGKGLPHSELIKIYKELKKLQYQFIVDSVKDHKPANNFIVIE